MFQNNFPKGGTKMRQFLASGLGLTILLTLSTASFGDGKTGTPSPPTNAGLEKMKKLAGTWVAADKDGKPTDQVVSIIKVTAGGSVVHETLFPGQPDEMGHCSLIPTTECPCYEARACGRECSVAGLPLWAA
jgi:hypothetical protein